jgi:hypothetical protein
VNQFFSGYMFKVAMSVGIIVLVGLVAADIWLWQSDDDSPSTSDTNQNPPSGSNLPGLPTQGGGGTSTGANVGDSVDLEIDREVVVTDDGLIAGDGASVGDSVQIDTTGAGGQGTIVGDNPSFSDSVDTNVQQAQQPPPPPVGGGGPSVVASFGDSADLVVRDSSGNIKQQESVK